VSRITYFGSVFRANLETSREKFCGNRIFSICIFLKLWLINLDYGVRIDSSGE
jgi:hypothetical protein